MVLVFALLVCGATSAGATTKISNNNTGGNSNNGSYVPVVSADGRYIVYQSDASNIVSGDTNGKTDIFLFDSVLNKTIRANRGPNGAQAADGDSWNPAISADGRYIVYQSWATNLVSGDNNGVQDIFLYDRVTSTTIRANRGPANAQALNGGSYGPSISADGRYIVYESDATNLVSGDSNDLTDIFLYDRVTSTTIRANRGPANAQAVYGASYSPKISGDGRYIVYQSDANNLVSGDTNNWTDIFLYDRVLNKTIRANRGTNNAQTADGWSYNPDISADGRYIVYESTATNIVSGDTNVAPDIFLYDRVLNKTIRANRGPANAQSNNSSSDASISGDGRYIVYTSDATNLVTSDTNNNIDVFLYDRILNTTVRINRGPAGAQATGGPSSVPKINGDGSKIVYSSGATNLVNRDVNGYTDIFLYSVRRLI